MSERQIFSVAFEEAGAVITYIDPGTDVRVKGAVMVQHSVRLDVRHPDYADDIEALEHKVRKVLDNALEDFASSEPWKPEVESEDDDEENEMGMGQRARKEMGE